MTKKHVRENINWPCILPFKKLSKDFIRGYKGKVDWKYLSVSLKSPRKKKNNNNKI